MPVWMRTLAAVILGALLLLGAPAAAIAAPAAITVLEAGSGDQQVLAVKPTVGETQAVTMRMSMSQKMDMAGMDMPEMALPTMVLGMKATVDEVRDNGDIAYHFEVTSARAEASDGVMPAMVSAVEAEIAQTVGLVGHAVVTPQGTTKEARYEVPEGASESVRQTYTNMENSLDQMGAPLPATPVGVGAKWVAKQRIDKDGMTIEQAITYTLTERKGDLVVLDVDLSQTAPRQQVDAPGMPPGAVATLTRLASTGSGRIELDLGRVLPARSSMNLGMDLGMEVNAQGQDMAMGMTMKTEMSLAPTK